MGQTHLPHDQTAGWAHSPPPRTRVASCHCRTYFRHLPTPSGVMLKEHMGSPAMVSAPSCSTTASGLNTAYTSFSTLRREAAAGVTTGTAQRVLMVWPWSLRLTYASQGFCILCSYPLIQVMLPLLPVSLLPLLLSGKQFCSQSTHHKADEGKSITENTGEVDLVLISLVVASNHMFTSAAPSGRAARKPRGFSLL